MVLPSETSVSFGVLLLPTHQTLDQSGAVDMLTNFTPEYLSNFPPDLLSDLPAPIPIQFHFISPITGTDLSPVNGTSGPKMVPTCTLTTCPKLDILLIPGPSPTLSPPKEMVEFMRRVWRECESILTVCTGSIYFVRCLLEMGPNEPGVEEYLSHGGEISTNKACLKMLSSAGALPGGRGRVNWSRKARWSCSAASGTATGGLVEGKVWSSAGVTAGMDMALAWVRWRWPEKKALLHLVEELSEFKLKEKDEDEFAYLLEGVSW